MRSELFGDEYLAIQAVPLSMNRARSGITAIGLRDPGMDSKVWKAFGDFLERRVAAAV